MSHQQISIGLTFPPDCSHLILLGSICTLFYCVKLTVYRVYFSPLASVPGLFLAKGTHWYEFYYDVIHTGNYYGKIRKLHEEYGMRALVYSDDHCIKITV
ncbi:hypothetical protein F5Y07DRAFT_373256 [Xylaria sp. FL0933]|nr:hypothetical protein F5Y07DRAFT_373256 [Xylaria sp. FL0933]